MVAIASWFCSLPTSVTCVWKMNTVQSTAGSRQGTRQRDNVDWGYIYIIGCFSGENWDREALLTYKPYTKPHAICLPMRYLSRDGV